MLLQGRDCFGRRIHQLFRLTQVEQRGDTSALPRLDEIERLPPRGECVLGDIQFVIQLAEAEVAGGHIAHQCCNHRLTVFFRT